MRDKSKSNLAGQLSVDAMTKLNKISADNGLSKIKMVERLINDYGSEPKVISKPVVTPEQLSVKKEVKPAVDREPTMAELLKAANKSN